MKKALCFVLLSAATALAQQAAPSGNPVTDNVRQRLARQSKILIATAEAMPADKYEFKPTKDNMTFGHLMGHIVEANNFVCSKIAGQEHKSDVKDTDGKDKIVAAMKDSMDFCGKAMADVKDSDLGQEVEMFGGRKAPKAAAVIELPVDWADHYGAAAVYLRLNNILPPTAVMRQQQQSQQKGAEKK